MKKKGVSPLIATVLLVAFAVAIGAVVSNYIIKQTKEFKPEKLVEDSLLCDDVNLGYSIDPSTDILPKDWLCLYEPNVLAGINIVNKGKFSIYKYSLTTQGKSSPSDEPAGHYDGGTFTKDASGIKPGKKQQMFFGVNGDIRDKTIRIIPIVKNPEAENEFVKCTKSALVIDYDRLCKDINNGNCESDCVENIDIYKNDNLNP